jgi:Transposase, Mutator family
VNKTNALESLVIAGFVRGLSTRDVEATLTEALGESAAVSKSTVSRICADIKEQFENCCRRQLDDVELDYLFLDGSHFKYHTNASAEPVLAASGIDTDGKPAFQTPACPDGLGTAQSRAAAAPLCAAAGGRATTGGRRGTCSRACIGTLGLYTLVGGANQNHW